MKFFFAKLILFALLLFSFCANSVFADDTPFQKGLKGTAGPAGYDTAKDGKSIDPLIGSIIQSALSFLGVIFLLLMIYGGYLWMTAQGNDQQVEKAKNLIIAAIIGVIVVASAYAISYFVVGSLSKEVLI